MATYAGDNREKTIIVTGANSGIGLETSRVFCENGYDVILACRSEEKAWLAIETIKKKHPNCEATFMKIDTSSLRSVREFVDNFHQTGKKLFALVNNAGIYPKREKEVTENGFELAMGTNHLGPFLLTNLLLDDLKKSAKEFGGAKIVNVVSRVQGKTSMHGIKFLPLDPEDPFLEKEGVYKEGQAYRNSKLAQVWFTVELSRRLAGSDVTVNCLCPGIVVFTRIFDAVPFLVRFFLRYILGGLFSFTKVTHTIPEAGQAVTDLVLKPEMKGVSGKFFIDGVDTRLAPEASDEQLQKIFWDKSLEFVKLEQ